MKDKKPNFANGFDCFCMNCGEFFSAQFESGDIGRAEFCPNCGEDLLVFTTDGISHHCFDHATDPVNFYRAFPPDEPIPGSRTGATPRQVSIIIDLVAMRKQGKLPVTAEGIAGHSSSLIETVRKVLEELHITETGGEQ